MNKINPDDTRYQMYNCLCNVKDEDGNYLYDEQWMKEHILGEDIEEKENPDD